MQNASEGPSTVSYLIFCSFEVGGLPFRIVEILNRHGIRAYYVSVQPGQSVRAAGRAHDSTSFHFGNRHEEWDLSHLFHGRLFSGRLVTNTLERIKKDYGITHCLATGRRAYLLKRAGIPFHYWAFGSDLDQACFRPDWAIGYPLWRKALAWLKFLAVTRPEQRATMHAGEAVMIAPYQLPALERICPGKRLFFFPHFIDVKDYDKLSAGKTESRKAICAETGTDYYFFSAARHYWAGPRRHVADNKGNDTVLKAFAEYRKAVSERVKLVLVNKGPDVEASRKLARELGIEGDIVWVNEMSRDKLERFYLGASACFGQFGTPVVSFAVLEPMAQATPCISYHEEVPAGVPFYGELPPMINSRDPGEIASQLVRLMSDAEYRADLEYQSWRWVKDNCSEEKFVESFLNIYESTN